MSADESGQDRKVAATVCPSLPQFLAVFFCSSRLQVLFSALFFSVQSIRLEVSPNQCLNESMANDEIRSALRALLLEKSVRTGEFTLASGKTSDLYIDCRVTAMDPHGANLIGKLGWETVKQEIANREVDIQAIGGMTLGADPISLAVGMTSASDEKPLQVFTVRKEPKGHGKGKQIEGNFSEGDTIIIVDDVITTGGSTIKAMDVIEAAGGKIAFALVLVDREEGGREAIEARGVPVIPLFSRSTLLD